MTGLFPEDSAERKTFPVFSGLLQYFPTALAQIARHSYAGNEKHNPGQPLHHDRAKSGDEADAMVRHLMEGDFVGMAWRALSLLQKHEEAHGAPIAPASRNADRKPPVVIPHDIAAKMLRDGIVPEAASTDTLNPAESTRELNVPISVHHATEAPMPPHDTLQDDDEGERYDVSGDPSYAAGGTD